MFDRIRQAFTKPKLSEAEAAFITKLTESDIWILAIGLRGTPVIPSITDPSAWEIIAEHRIDISEVGEDDSVSPFNYDRGNGMTLPFFTTQERALNFRAKSGLKADLSLLQPFSIAAGFVATPDNDIFELVLDPCSPGEKILNGDERLLLRKLSPAPDA